MKTIIIKATLGFLVCLTLSNCQPDKISTPEACPLFAVLLKSTDDRDFQRVANGTVSQEQYERNSTERKTLAAAMCYYALQDRDVNNNF